MFIDGPSVTALFIDDLEQEWPWPYNAKLKSSTPAAPVAVVPVDKLFLIRTKAEATPENFWPKALHSRHPFSQICVKRVSFSNLN